MKIVDVDKKLKLIKDRIFEPSIEDELNFSALHAYCSASFQTFLSKINIVEHTNGFRKVLFNQAQAKYERLDIEIIDNLDVEELILPDKGLILCAFHYGAYQLITPALIKKNRKFFVVINNSDANNSNVLKESSDYFKFGKKRYKNTVQDTIIHLSIHNENFVFQAKELLENGYIMLVFIDGNSGIDGIMNTMGKNMLEIDFFDKKIFVKKGIASLSYSFKVPIFPIFFNRKDNGKSINICCYEPIFPNSNKTKSEYEEEAIPRLYELLSNHLKQRPYQWDGWLYVHKWLNLESLKDNKSTKYLRYSENENLIFNKNKYIKFNLKNKIFLLDKDTHLAYEINESFLKIINNEFKNLNSTDKKYYIKKGILINYENQKDNLKFS
jgi:lauroyl/myristoyl acyltransferase